MKTADEKAEQFIRDFVETGRFGKDSLVTLLKEQDRDTRHACADAVAGLHLIKANGGLAIFADDAEQAIMNTKVI